MAEAYPAGPRVLAGVGAVAALALGALLAGGYVEQGYPYSAGATLAATLPLVSFLGMLAVAPEGLQRLLSRFTRLDLRDGGHVVAAVVMAGALYVVLGLGSLASGVHALEALAQGRSDEVLGEVSPRQLALALVEGLIVLVVPALLYVSFVEGHGPVGAMRAMGLRGEGAGTAILVGFGVAFGFVFLLGVASLVVDRLGIHVPENERALSIARSVTVAGALGIAVASSLGEEVFFRGFLQPRIGLLAQAVVFSLAHLNYANVLELVVTFALGLAFGLMRQKTGSLWAPIAAHFLFNLLMLLAGIYGTELLDAQEPGLNETNGTNGTPPGNGSGAAAPE